MTFTALELDILRMLRRSAEPLSGRQVADIAGIAPNTANRLLRALQTQGLVRSARDGRAMRWTTTADVAALSELADSPDERVALVVTAVELEHTEVRNRLVNAERVRTGDIWMLRGEMPGGQIDWTVYLARAGMGNATSAALVGLAARNLRANVVAFVGTAAGLKSDDQRHLDVVVASRIHNPYAGKQVPTDSGSKLLGRDRTYALPAPLVSLVNTCITETAWTTSVRNQHYDGNHAHAYLAPIVSVEAVQTDSNGPVLREIRERFQDAAALDMESFGLAAGSDIHDLPVLAIRGLSDFVGDKAKVGNDDLQPRAARNAAGFLRELLVFAHPDDFKRGEVSPPIAPRDDHSEAPAVALPGGVEIWMERLYRASQRRADAAMESLVELQRAGVTVATGLSRFLHRPPVWLREDVTGDGWALVSSLASIAGSRVAWRGYEQAAAAAEVSGDLDAAAYFAMTAGLERVARDADEDDAKGAEPDPRFLDGLADYVIARLGTVIDFYRSVLDGDLPKIKACAEIAVASLGLTDESGVLRAPTDPVKVVSIDPSLRDIVAATMLRHLAQVMLAPGAADQLGVQSGLANRALRGNPVTRDLADDGLRLAQWAVALRPNSESCRLTNAQMMLGVLVSMSGRSSTDVEDEVSKRARLVEADALLVREALSAWDGSTASALAIAARARSIQGDFPGALRLLLPAPDGLATQREAKRPEVVRLGAYLARVIGKDELALELAAKNPDRVEGELMRAAVLGGHPQMNIEANKALFTALELSAGRSHYEVQALMALSRRFNSLDRTEQASVKEHIEKLAELDRELADVMRARVALGLGNPAEALRFVRGIDRNELVLDTHADALVASGRPEEAARMVFDEGLRRGDIPLATEALEIAMDNGAANIGREIALNLLGREDGKPVRLKALRALQRISRSENNWQEVANRTEEIIEESKANDLPIPETEWWRLVEALYFLERFEKALAVLRSATAVSFNERGKAHLFLSVLRRAADEQRALNEVRTRPPIVDLGDKKLYAMFMRAAADWANDEQIAAAAMSVVLMAPHASFTETQVAEFRAYADSYFERHGDAASIKQVQVEDDNLDALIDFLRSGSARQEALENMSREVRAGRFPLAALTEAAGRTCTESLIRRDLGYIIAIADDDAIGHETAREALHRRVVVDTSALVVGGWTGQPFKKLAAHLDSVIVPAPLREDVSSARSSLAMKSTATLGWDTQRQRPTVSEISPDQARVYADAVEQVWADIQGLQVAPVADTGRRDGFLSAITVAQEFGLPVWIDDAVLRGVARSLGVPAFGSLDLIRALEDEVGVAAAIRSLRDHRVVDLPIDEPWSDLANRAEWKIDSAFALAISRPAAWHDVRNSFVEFQSLVRRRPKDLEAEATVAWAHLAANGLAMAVVPSARPRAVSALLAWAALCADSFYFAAGGDAEEANGPDGVDQAGRVTALVIAAAEAVRDQHYPGIDALGPLVDVICRVLLESVGPELTSRIVASLVDRLDREVGTRVFMAYIQSAGK
ncbi:helix-turn-helix domain-containing protein [Kribbella sp. CA-245084]|uniref:phosphorylase family protein n=1 Tax=Kribbella sp. CA-245084 TaxID=3239940 RepID=UPI003D90A483